MALSDTAEYWWDVKWYNRKPYMGRDFIHIPNSTCGHLSPVNSRVSYFLNDINCFACLKLIKENGDIYKLEKGMSRREQSERDRESHRRRHGQCTCGGWFTIRTNKSSGQQFLGCGMYPKCKKTKSL